MNPAFTGKDALLSAIGGFPLARRLREPVTCYRRADTLLWTGVADGALMAQASGDGRTAIEIFLDLPDRAAVASLHLPRVASVEPISFVECNDWSLLWTYRADPPPPDPTEELTEGDHPAIDAILDDVLDYTGNRSKNPKIRKWYGIRRQGELVAVAADRSRDGTGYVAGVAVAREHQGQGYGSILTRVLTARLVAEFGVCSLGVMAHNTGALALWERIGYDHRADLTSLRLPGRLA
jgi:GNAT superfamily N-acetyltransferase